MGVQGGQAVILKDYPRRWRDRQSVSDKYPEPIALTQYVLCDDLEDITNGNWFAVSSKSFEPQVRTFWHVEDISAQLIVFKWGYTWEDNNLVPFTPYTKTKEYEQPAVGETKKASLDGRSPLEMLMMFRDLGLLFKRYMRFVDGGQALEYSVDKVDRILLPWCQKEHYFELGDKDASTIQQFRKDQIERSWD